jgi:AcrR family transcriptional regulator
MGIRERKKADTRRALVDAASELFAERGVQATTMDDIAQAAGMSRTSVFNYFGHKEMILCEIGARYVNEIAGPLRGADRSNPGKAFGAVTDALAELASRQPALIAAIARETTHPDPERRKCARETMGYSELVEEMLDDFDEQGVLRHPDYKESYGNQMVDLLSGVLARLAGVASYEELRREIGRSLELFMRGAMRQASPETAATTASAPSAQLAGA